MNKPALIKPEVINSGLLNFQILSKAYTPGFLKKFLPIT